MTQRFQVREAVGVFDSYNQLQQTIKDLEESGFNRREISVLGNEIARERRFGQSQIDPAQLEDDPDAPRSANIAAEEVGVAQGVVIGIGLLAGVVIGFMASTSLPLISAETVTLLSSIAGAAIGALLAETLGEQYIRFFDRQAAEGGLLLWVQTSDKEHERKAKDLLRKHGAHDVHVHDIPLAA